MIQPRGLGDPASQLSVYIGNTPNYLDLLELTNVRPLQLGDIAAIGQACGNGWRKVFNVYAKLVFALNMPSLVNVAQYDNWQSYRDNHLLRAKSNTSLRFTSPDLSSTGLVTHGWHIVMGKTYAQSLSLPSSLRWLDKEFALDKQAKLIVCPYFDYRQLSNIKIIRLVSLIQEHTGCA